MADVVERGQLILITGLVMAIGFVALALLLNTAIYTENLASRGSDVGARDAIEFRHTSAEAIGGILDEENELEHESRAAVRANVSGDIDAFNRLRTIRGAESGVIANHTGRQIHEGTHLKQTVSSAQMLSESGDHNWTLAEGANGIRNFSVTARGGLNDTTTPGTEAFNVSVTGAAGNRWSLYLYRDGTDSRLAIRNGTGAISRNVCSGPLPSSRPFTVDLTAGTINGTECSAIEFAKGTTPPHDVIYTWGNRSEGTYHLTVNTTTTNGFAGFGDSGPPQKVPYIYSVAVELTYMTDELTYRDRVRVTPEGST